MYLRDFLGSPWLRLHASTAGGTDLIPGRGTKIPHAAWCSQKKKVHLGSCEEGNMEDERNKTTYETHVVV